MFSMANGNLYDKFRERGLSFSEAGLVENSLDGNAFDNVRIPKKKSHVFSYDDMLRMRGVIVPDSSKFKYKSKPQFEDLSEEYVAPLEKFVSGEIETRLSYETSPENLNEIASLLAYAKDHNLDIDTFHYTLEASKKMRCYEGTPVKTESNKVKVSRSEMDKDFGRRE